MTDHKILTPYFLDEALPDMKELAENDWTVIEPALPGTDTQGRMIALYQSLTRTVKETVEEGDRPVSIAGDCCTTIAVLAGLQQAGLEPVLIWFDAHGDFNTWETSPSGFLGGMPLAMMVGRGEQRLVEGAGLRTLEETKVILTDARDLDPEERVAVSASAVQHLPSVGMLLNQPLSPGPLYVHFDVDVINPLDAPAMNYLAEGGPRVAELRQVFAHLAASGRVAAVSLSSWNPELDEDGRSREAALSLLATVLARP